MIRRVQPEAPSAGKGIGSTSGCHWCSHVHSHINHMPTPATGTSVRYNLQSRRAARGWHTGWRESAGGRPDSRRTGAASRRYAAGGHAPGALLVHPACAKEQPPTYARNDAHEDEHHRPRHDGGGQGHAGASAVCAAIGQSAAAGRRVRPRGGTTTEQGRFGTCASVHDTVPDVKAEGSARVDFGGSGR